MTAGSSICFMTAGNQGPIGNKVGLNSGKLLRR